MKKLIASGLALSLVLGGTMTTSAFAGTPETQEQVKSQVAVNSTEIEPKAIPAVAATVTAKKAAAYVGGAFVTGAAAKAGADAWDYAKKQVGRNSVQPVYADYDEIKTVFDQ
ncbi:hypothetical protein [Desmospora profundinema]|uniref:FlaG/FlaF family flagellin (Archaellin) n=1 Tax=Desmospora profundinema TaxID=1571184 RepID=A0ABU1ILU4_9BACL|nr:hypothetical protein [Desmospora profundinema]MDR6225752.1 FlaG/FlaF family flagellin (archaellin) [Desmospora profundinema]